MAGAEARMNYVDKFLDAASNLKSIGLRHRPQDEVQVAIASAFAESFEAMPPSERNAARALVVGDSRIGDKLVSLSGYLAEVAINKNCADVLRTALILHAIEDFQGDPRENFRRLALIVYASRKLNVPLGPIIASISELTTNNGKSHLDGFAYFDLHSFGVRADVTEGVFRFVPVPELQKANPSSSVKMEFNEWERWFIWLIIVAIIAVLGKSAEWLSG